MDEHKRNPLFYLNYEDKMFDESLFNFLISKNINVKQVDKYGNTILLYANNPCLDAVKRLHSAGVDIYKNDKNGNSLLFKSDNLDVVQYLVSQYVKRRI